MSENEIEVPEDYAAEELRPDVLCYTTPPLAADAVLTGDCSVELFISCLPVKAHGFVMEYPGQAAHFIHEAVTGSVTAVSYTHLDVYKRQALDGS